MDAIQQPVVANNTKAVNNKFWNGNDVRFGLVTRFSGQVNQKWFRDICFQRVWTKTRHYDTKDWQVYLRIDTK